VTDGQQDRILHGDINFGSTFVGWFLLIILIDTAISPLLPVAWKSWPTGVLFGAFAGLLAAVLILMLFMGVDRRD